VAVAAGHQSEVMLADGTVEAIRRKWDVE